MAIRDLRHKQAGAAPILIERYDLDETQAFEVLRRYSQDHNIKLRDVAAHLTETRQLPTITTTLRLPQSTRPPRSARAPVTCLPSPTTLATSSHT